MDNEEQGCAEKDSRPGDAVLNAATNPALETAEAMETFPCHNAPAKTVRGVVAGVSPAVDVSTVKSDVSSSIDATTAVGNEMQIEGVPSPSSNVDPPSAVVGAEASDVNVEGASSVLSGSTSDAGAGAGTSSKRPKSPHASSSSDSALTSSSNITILQGAESVDVSDSLQNLNISTAEQAEGEGEATTSKSKKKKKKKKKKKTGAETPAEGMQPENLEAMPSSDITPQSGDLPAGADKAEPGSGRPQSGSKRTKKSEAARPKSGDKERDAAKTGTPEENAQSENSASQNQGRQRREPQKQGQVKQQGQQQQGQQQQQQGPKSQQRQQQQPNQRQNQQQQQQGQQGKKHQHQKHHRNHFEPYWPADKLSAELKRGAIFQGKIRINPKNYEDAYVPLPDGTADIYVPGMGSRNRALNGDIVAVQLDNRENWRVYCSELDHYEKQNIPASGQDTEEKTEKEGEEDTKSNGAVAMDIDDKGGDKSEEGPDVVVEEEKVIELDSGGQPISMTVTKPSPTDTPSSQPISTPSKGAKPKPGQSDKAADSPNSARNRQRYMSVKDVMDKGSPVARQLFTHQGSEASGEEARSVNMDKFMQKTGKVVAIVEKKHSRASSGSLRPMQDNNPNCAIFSPTDSRVPRVIIPATDLPQGFKERPGDFANVLFIARIVDWNETMKMPKGTLSRSLGEAGEIEPQTEAILIENDVDDSEFSDEVLESLPKETPWTIPASELSWRRDFRQECVFTIDPSTARDLDDALSCHSLGDGVYEVGVHIADVSYFVKEGTKLDEVARNRATSVYLVQKVVPMLPRLLCEQLCSLNPDEDRLTFSVVWKMTENGEILHEWFGRSVIRSCVKLSYDHAQGFIEQPDKPWTAEELPPISEGFSVDDIKSRVLQMDKMAKAMRMARHDSGALRLDQLKIQFTMDKNSGLPNGYFVYEQRDSNKLVEEFMLLANMAVAHKIKTCHPDKALLRRHPPPQSRMIDELKETCASLGYPMEVDTAKDIQRSLLKYTGEDELSRARLQVLVVLCSKPMQNAKYFCCGVLADEQLYHHYALNVPLYTHFTSPIRRYPDILVHRTLAASLDYCSVMERSSSEIHVIAEHCNDKKTNAKRASELSNEIFFSVFVKEAGPLEEKGMVMNVLDKSFDVYILALGVVKRVYCEKLPLEGFTHHKEGKRPELTMVWKPDDGCPHAVVTQKISIFSSVNCVLKSDPEPLRWSAIIRRPLQGDPTYVQ